MPSFRPRWGAHGAAVAGLLISVLASACIPYAVATTAEPVAPDKRVSTVAFTVMPPVSLSERRGRSFLSMDGEMRWGTDSLSDIGVRIVSFSGVTANYKRLLTPRTNRTLVAIMPGLGLVNLAEHAHFELTLIASRRAVTPASGARGDRRLIIPYGGLRVMQVAPLNANAVHDQPTAGAFFGVRIGDASFALTPEFGVFHDHSALGVRRQSLVVVPSVSIQAEGIRDRITGRPPPRGRPPFPPRRPRPRLPPS